MPPDLGNWNSVHKRFARWRDQNIWEKILHELIDRGFPGYVPTTEECERMGKTQAQMIRWRT